MNQTPVVAAVQRSCGEDRTENLDAMLTMVEAALDDGATIVIPQELFQGIYFCQYERQEFFKWAVPAEDSPAIDAVVQLTTGREAVVPVSFFERAGATLFNSVAIVDSGRVLGIYRKTHIPDGPGYEEKFYFTPGDTGFRTWATSQGRLGVGICWDQWFPEAARAMALQGADLLAYPTAIGSELGDLSELDSSDMWRRAMEGHAVCNHVPVVAANRVGREDELTFYGSSFIVDHRGRDIITAGRDEEQIIMAELDHRQAREDRAAWGIIRDRRPEHYAPLSSGAPEPRFG